LTYHLLWDKITDRKQLVSKQVRKPRVLYPKPEYQKRHNNARRWECHFCSLTYQMWNRCVFRFRLKI